ncbi:MAG: hypothetical protein ACYDDV_09700 [Methanoregula sp.]
MAAWQGKPISRHGEKASGEMYKAEFTSIVQIIDPLIYPDYFSNHETGTTAKKNQVSALL